MALNEHQAYAAMILFLRRHNENTKSEGEVAALLSGMYIVAKGDTFDPGYWDEWLEDVQRVLNASQTPEDWERFEEDHLAFLITKPDGTVWRARPGAPNHDTFKRRS